ncbi:MAG: GntR family transcriptional regulator [Lentisphaeria bacterium]|nr:GntR family transcriptional regulator [Lentisphaeria bacterium]
MLSNHTGEEPVYKQLRELFLQRIEKGELAPGDRISNENSLADQFQVSRTTIRRALHGLECDGLIVRFPGKGTFINSAVHAERNPRFTVGINFFSGFKTNFYYGEIVEGIMAEAELRNIQIRVLSPDLTQDDPAGLDGLIFAGKPKPDSELLRKAAKGTLPAVGYNYRLGHAGFIGIDNHAEAAKGTETLIRKGCREIGYFGTHSGDRSSVASLRFAGYCDALKNHGLEVDMKRVQWRGPSERRFQAALDFFRHCGPIDALFVSTAGMLFDVLYAMNMMKISLEDLQLLCFDNLEALQLNWPGISYIRMPLHQIGERMLDAVRQRLILKERAPVVNEFYQTEIISEK